MGRSEENLTRSNVLLGRPGFENEGDTRKCDKEQWIFSCLRVCFVLFCFVVWLAFLQSLMQTRQHLTANVVKNPSCLQMFHTNECDDNVCPMTVILLPLYLAWDIPRTDKINVLFKTIMSSKILQHWIKYFYHLCLHFFESCMTTKTYWAYTEFFFL